MTEKYKILTEFVKDISCETPDVESFLETKENISKYNLSIDINSKPIKNKIIEVNILLKFRDVSEKKKSHYELTYSAIARLDDSVKDKKEMEKIVLISIPNEIFPRLKNLFISILKNSGLGNIKFDTQIDFEKLYNERLN